MTTDNLESIIGFEGIDPTEAKIYLAALQQRQPTISGIAQETGMNRTSLYPYLGRLKEKGLLAEVYSGKKKLYIPGRPETLSRLLKDKAEEISRSLPLLNQYYHTYRNRPKVRMLEGEEGIKQVYADVLQAKKEILMYSMIDTYFSRMGNLHQDFMVKRVKAKIPVRALLPKTKKAIERKRSGERELRSIRFVPRKLGDQMASATWIYGDKVAYFNFQEQPVSVIVENEDIAKSQRALFEFAWSAAQK